MFRNFVVINIFLFLIVCFLGAELYGTLNRPMEVPTEAPAPEPKGSPQDNTKGSKFVRQQSFDIIARANLFNPSRSSKKEDEKVIATPPPKNQPKLFGTIILGGRKLAILEDPSTRERKTFGLNESVGGYTVLDIAENSVVLTWSGEEVTVQLREDKGVKPLPKREAPKRHVQRATAPRSPRERAQRRRRRPRRTRANVPPPTSPAQEQDNVER